MQQTYHHDDSGQRTTSSLAPTPLCPIPPPRLSSIKCRTIESILVHNFRTTDWDSQLQHQEMTTNPSHILIARNSRGSNNPSAALSSPTETHAAASGIFRSGPVSGVGMGMSGSVSVSGSGAVSLSSATGGIVQAQWALEETNVDETGSIIDGDEPFGVVELDPTFTRQGRFPGTVKIVVEATTFW